MFCNLLQFLTFSREQLSASLAKAGLEYFYNLYEVVSDVYPEKIFELLPRKIVVCYKYIDLFRRLDEPALPPRQAFFNKLGDGMLEGGLSARSAHVENFHRQSL